MSVTPFGLIGGYIAGYAFADIVMLKGVKKDIQIFKKVSVKRMKEVAIQYKKFPLFSFWSSIANTISPPQVPAFLLAYFYSTAVVGHFSLANQVVNLPMGIVGGAIGQVFFQKVSEVKNGNGEGDMKVIVGEVYNKLISIGLFPMILLVILGEQIFTFAFGEEWGGISGTYVRILVPGYFLSFCLRLLQPSITYLKNRKSGSFSACLSLSQEWWRWLSEEGMGVLSLLLPCIVLRELCSGYGTMHTSWGLQELVRKRV